MTTFLISVLLFWGAYFGGPEGLNAAMTDTGAAYLINKGRAHWMCSLPAAFLTFVCVSFLIVAPLGLGMAPVVGYVTGTVVGLGILVLFIVKGLRTSRPILQNTSF